MNEIPKIYCINVKSSVDRKKRMIHRFETAGIMDNVTFIEAIPSTSSLTDYYIGHIDNQVENRKKYRNVTSCRASHLKAIKQYLEDDSSIYYNNQITNELNNNYAIICEDDIMLHNNFIEKYNQLIKNMPKTTNIFCLSYIMWNYDGIKWSGIDHRIENICTMGKDTWGAQMYLISRKYAMVAIEKFDKPNTKLKDYLKQGQLITSELITRMSDEGYIAYPPLAIEDCIKSVIGDIVNTNHVLALKRFGYKNYNEGEIDDISPLSKV